MTMTKKELITLLREDARYQREELAYGKQANIRINGVVVHGTGVLKLQFQDHYLFIYCSLNGVSITVAHVFYDDIHSIGYKYSSDAEIATRLCELREADFNAHCCKEV